MTHSSAVEVATTPKTNLTRGDSILDSLIEETETRATFTQGPMFKVSVWVSAGGSIENNRVPPTQIPFGPAYRH